MSRNKLTRRDVCRTLAAIGGLTLAKTVTGQTQTPAEAGVVLDAEQE